MCVSSHMCVYMYVFMIVYTCMWNVSLRMPPAAKTRGQDKQTIECDYEQVAATHTQCDKQQPKSIIQLSCMCAKHF